MINQEDLRYFEIEPYLQTTHAQQRLTGLDGANLSRLLDELPLPLAITTIDFCQPVLEAYRNNRLESFLGKFLRQFSPLLLNETYTDINLDTVGRHLHIPMIFKTTLPASADLDQFKGKLLCVSRNIYYVDNESKLEQILLPSTYEDFLKSMEIDSNQFEGEKIVTYTKLSQILTHDKMPRIITEEVIQNFFTASICWLAQIVTTASDQHNKMNPEVSTHLEYKEIAIILDCFKHIEVQELDILPLDQDWISFEEVQKQINDLEDFLQRQKQNSVLHRIQRIKERVSANDFTSESCKRYILLGELRAIYAELRMIPGNPQIKAYLLAQKKQEAQAFLKAGGDKRSLYIPGRPNSSIFSDDEFHSLLLEQLSSEEAQRKVDALTVGIDEYIAELGCDMSARHIISTYLYEKNRLLWEQEKISDATFKSYEQIIKKEPLSLMTAQDFSQLSHWYQKQEVTREANIPTKHNILKTLALIELKTTLQNEGQNPHTKLSQFMIHQYPHQQLLNLSQHTWWEKFIQFFYELLCGELAPEVRLSREHEKMLALAQSSRWSTFFKSSPTRVLSDTNEKLTDKSPSLSRGSDGEDSQ